LYDCTSGFQQDEWQIMTETQQNTMSREEYIARVHASWARWLATIDALTPEELHQPNVCGHWSTKDLIGHIAAWDTAAVDKLRRIVAGEGHPDEGESVDEFNARTAEAFKDTPLDELLERMARLHALLVESLESTEAPDEVFQWVIYATEDDTWKHYDEHRQQVIDRFGDRDAV
jgi:uncharacterized damage-inducible protein DinB